MIPSIMCYVPPSVELLGPPSFQTRLTPLLISSIACFSSWSSMSGLLGLLTCLYTSGFGESSIHIPWSIVEVTNNNLQLQLPVAGVLRGFQVQNPEMNSFLLKSLKMHNNRPTPKIYWNPEILHSEFFWLRPCYQCYLSYKRVPEIQSS